MYKSRLRNKSRFRNKSSFRTLSSSTSAKSKSRRSSRHIPKRLVKSSSKRRTRTPHHSHSSTHRYSKSQKSNSRRPTPRNRHSRRRQADKYGQIRKADRQGSKASKRRSKAGKQRSNTDRSISSKIGSYDKTYFRRPVIGRTPRTRAEQILEELGERKCRCQMHVSNSFLTQSKRRCKDSRRQSGFGRINYAVCNNNYKKSLARYADELENTSVNNLPECGSNLNFHKIPTDELYAYALEKANTKKHSRFFVDLPEYPESEREWKQIRPTLVKMLNKWQKSKD